MDNKQITHTAKEARSSKVLLFGLNLCMRIIEISGSLEATVTKTTECVEGLGEPSFLDQPSR